LARLTIFGTRLGLAAIRTVVSWVTETLAQVANTKIVAVTRAPDGLGCGAIKTTPPSMTEASTKQALALSVAVVGATRG